MKDPERPNAMEENIFNAALPLENAAKRRAYLDQACEGDTALRVRIEKLLAVANDTFFDAPGSGPLASSEALVETVSTGSKIEVSDVPSAAPGERIGRYKLLQKIGEGGCGVVYMAEQEEPVRRRVALKVIKLGMDTRSVIARFEAERQALAMMDHPNIAKVFDAGATETGRPYFVMELVRGMKITDYCDEHNVATRQRLELFVNACHAIQHAHQKGIIHRDIKPSNILVTVNDGVAVPKVIDFGIAKATGGRLTDQTLFTAFEQFIGTPAYMSPEQATMTSVDIDTRSDIYSLGVLLYELLTGKTPFDAKELLASGLDELRRTILEKEPVRPSTRLTQELAAADVSRRRFLNGAEPSSNDKTSADSRRRLQELVALLRGDLDWIVMKCLEKDRTRRYETASALATDVKRHWDNEPVTARPPSAAYRFQKLVRRNKLAFATGTTIVVTLAGSAYFAQRQALQAKAALLHVRIVRADELFTQNKSSAALATLARVLRDSPDSSVAAERIMSALTQRKFSLPSVEALVHKGLVISIRVSPDGQRIVTVSQDGTARVWDAPAGKLLSQPLTHRTSTMQDAGMIHGSAIRCAAFSPDGRLLVTGSQDGTVRTWDGRTGQPLSQSLGHKGGVLSARFSPDSRLLVTTSEDKTARFWDPQTGIAVRSEPFVHGADVLGAEFSPDGASLVTFSLDKTARIWDLTTGRCLHSLKHESGLGSAHFSPDGKRLLTADWKPHARLWDVLTGEELPMALQHAMSVTSAQFSVDGKRIVTSSLDGTARVWDAGNGKPLGPPLRHDTGVLQARFSADGRAVLTLGEDKSLHVWDTDTQQPLIETLRHEIGTFEVAPNDGEVLTASSNIVYRWNLRLSALRPRRLNPQPFTTPSRLSPDETLRVNNSGNDCVQVVDRKTGEPLGDLLCHHEQITGTAFSPDGERLLTGSKDKTARIWDAHTGQPVTEPLQHGLPVQSVRFGGQRHQVVTTLDDKSTWLWEVPVASSRVPGWLPELAEAVGGQRVGRRGGTEPVPMEVLLTLTKKLVEAPPSDSYLAWVQRLLAERSQHTHSESRLDP